MDKESHLNFPFEKVQFFVERDAQLDPQDQNGIHFCGVRRYLHLINQGADLNKANKYGVFPKNLLED